MDKKPNLISLLGLACGLAETADELRAGQAVDPDYLDRVADTLWAFVGNPDRCVCYPDASQSHHHHKEQHMHGPGFNIKWGIKHPLQSTRESYLWARNESGYGRIRSALLVPFNWVAFTGVFHRG